MGNYGRRDFQRSWERLRLETEQGKQLALNRERIAGLYDCEGYRLARSLVHRVLGGTTLFVPSNFTYHTSILSLIHWPTHNYQTISTL